MGSSSRELVVWHRPQEVKFNEKQRQRTMTAARYYGHHDIRVEEVEEPQPREGQVVVDVEWCGNVIDRLISKTHFTY